MAVAARASAPARLRGRGRRRQDALPYGRRTAPAGSALAVMLVALMLGSLLNIQSLREAAERQEFGFRRDAALVLVWPLEQVSQILGLDEPRSLFDAEFRRSSTDAADAGDAGPAGTPGDEPMGLGGLVAQPAPQDPGPATTPIPAPIGVDPDAQAVPPPYDPYAPAQRTFSVTDPLRVWVIGDSVTEQLGPALSRLAAEPALPMDVQHDFRYSSGLARPDFFDWGARAVELIAETDPDAFVVMVGANDGQDIRDPDGRFRHIGEPEWEAIYRQRVGELMDLLAAEGRSVVWVGQPIMRTAAFDERIAYLDSLYDAEAATRPNVTFVDSRPLFATPDGRYADYLADAGQLVQMRQGDGIHLTRAGGERLAGAVLDALPQ